MKRFFRKFQHIERFGTTEVEGIEKGHAYVFPKIDGTNACIWLDEKGELQAGSRNRHLSLDNDNAGFLEWALKQDYILAYLKENPTHRLFGEWLVPHSLRTYQHEAWRKFYVFDVAIDKTDSEIRHEGDSKIKYLAFESYKPLLEKHKIDLIPPIAILKDAEYEDFVKMLDENNFLIEADKGIGEGIVVKNYEFYNRFGRQPWAKLITSDFKKKHKEKMGGGDATKLVEQQIAELYVTQALVEKVKAKIELKKGGFSSRDIPQLLNTVYYDIVKEEAWDFVKKFKFPTINFKTLKHFVIAKIKEDFPMLF